MILGLSFRNVLISTEHLYRVREIRTQIHKLKTAVVKDGNQSAPPPPPNPNLKGSHPSSAHNREILTSRGNLNQEMFQRVNDRSPSTRLPRPVSPSV